MNLFILSHDPIQAAKWNCDTHCIKIILEASQLLCTAFRLQGIEAPYKATHKNHPVSLWVRESKTNFEWTIRHAQALCAEYTERYGKVHKCTNVIKWCEDNIHLLSFPQEGLTKFAQAMPDDCKHEDSVQAYRNYYLKHKRHLFSWKQNKPEWVS